jgi:hypothetical protein
LKEIKLYIIFFFSFEENFISTKGLKKLFSLFQWKLLFRLLFYINLKKFYNWGILLIIPWQLHIHTLHIKRFIHYAFFLKKCFLWKRIFFVKWNVICVYCLLFNICNVLHVTSSNGIAVDAHTKIDLFMNDNDVFVFNQEKTKQCPCFCCF